jgi:hypothetical protein
MTCSIEALRLFAQLNSDTTVYSNATFRTSFRPARRSADRHSTTLGKEKYEPHPRHLAWDASSDDAQGQVFYFRTQLHAGINC